jgi:hypothetical protein
VARVADRHTRRRLGGSGLNRQAILISCLLALGCQNQDATPNGQVAAMATSTDPCYQSKNMTNATQQACLTIICAHLALAGVSCHSEQPVPPPQPSAMGGSGPVPVPTSTGGSHFATGGQGATGGASSTGGTSGVQSQEQLACANELKFGCPEGSATNCAGIMATRCASPKVKCDTACIVNATSKATLQNKCHVACGAL